MITQETLSQRPLSYSSLKEFAKSPAHYIQYINAKKEPSKEMNLGSLLHCMLLYSQQFTELFAVAPDVDRRTKDGKAAWEQFVAEAGDKIVVTGEDVDTANEIASRVFSNAEAKRTIHGCTEFEKEWSTIINGLPFRGFIDGVSDDYILELKTTSDGNPKTFIRDFHNRMYYMQSALYHYVTKKKVLYLVVETKPPYNFFIAPITQDYLDYGWMDVQRLTDLFNMCMALNAWDSGYDFNGPVTLELPQWIK
jgi:hypothetical protein